jgi:hypothetical protein
MNRRMTVWEFCTEFNEAKAVPMRDLEAAGLARWAHSTDIEILDEEGLAAFCSIRKLAAVAA